MSKRQILTSLLQLNLTEVQRKPRKPHPPHNAKRPANPCSLKPSALSTLRNAIISIYCLGNPGSLLEHRIVRLLNFLVVRLSKATTSVYGVPVGEQRHSGCSQGRPFKILVALIECLQREPSMNGETLYEQYSISEKRIQGLTFS